MEEGGREEEGRGEGRIEDRRKKERGESVVITVGGGVKDLLHGRVHCSTYVLQIFTHRLSTELYTYILTPLLPAQLINDFPHTVEGL